MKNEITILYFNLIYIYFFLSRFHFLKRTIIFLIFYNLQHISRLIAQIQIFKWIILPHNKVIFNHTNSLEINQGIKLKYKYIYYFTVIN